MGKKKATGMSKRLGFTDRATIAENKDILRYNDRLEREAKGLPPDESRGARGDRPDRRPSRPDGPGGSSSTRPPRVARPPRPPALDNEQTAALQAALAAAVGETGLDAAGAKIIERLAAYDSFDKASSAGWDLAAGGNAAGRTESEWALLRKTWLGVRFALLEIYATIKPELEPTLARERKQLVRIERPARPARPRGRVSRAGSGRPEGVGRPARQRPGPAPDSAGAPDKAKRTGPPSPADVARAVGRAGEPQQPQPATAATDEPASPDSVSTQGAPEVVGAPAAAEALAQSTQQPVPPDPVDALSTADAEAAEPAAADDDVAEVPPVDGEAIAAELRAEHGLAPVTGPAGAPEIEQDQLPLDLEP